MKRLITIFVLTLVASCATVTQLTGTSPEAQIATGANSVNAAAQLATLRLTDKRITKAQATSYSAILHTASDHLKAANVVLVDCRKRTASTQASNPDPCAGTVASDISLAVSVVGEVRKTLDSH